MLSYEDSGSGSAVIVLLPGRGGNAFDWDEELLHLVSSSGNFRIIRIDNRDSGGSPRFDHLGTPNPVDVWKGHSPPAYTLNDMANDVIELLHALEVQRAVFVGRSIGAMVAQCVAISNPEIVDGLVLISGTTGSKTVGQSTPEVAQKLASTSSTASEDPIVDAVRSASPFASWELGVTVDEVRARIERRHQRGYSKVGAMRQLAAVLAAEDRTEDLRGVVAPAVVIHGTSDSLIHHSGGNATADALPNAELILVDGLSHDLPRAVWTTLVNAIVNVAKKVRHVTATLEAVNASTAGSNKLEISSPT